MCQSPRGHPLCRAGKEMCHAINVCVLLSWPAMCTEMGSMVFVVR